MVCNIFLKFQKWIGIPLVTHGKLVISNQNHFQDLYSPQVQRILQYFGTAEAFGFLSKAQLFSESSHNDQLQTPNLTCLTGKDRIAELDWRNLPKPLKEGIFFWSNSYKKGT